MAKRDKTKALVMGGYSDANVLFSEVRRLLASLGFEERVKGSHHVFVKEGVEELINLQPARGGKCKPYQIKQLRRVLEDNKLA